MKLIKNWLVLPFLAVVLTGSAHALTLGDANYVGSIADGIPPNVANETSWVNYLIGLGADASVAVGVAPGLNATEAFDRSINPISWPTSATFGVKLEDGTFDSSPDVTGFSFVLGKYGNGQAAGQISHVWYVGNLSGSQMLPEQALSHVTLFNSSTTQVPDAGSTVGLLGLSLLLVAAIRRKLS